MTNTQTETTQLNGVNVGALLEAREALEAAPEAANFVFRASSEWMDGVHTKIEMSGFYGLGEEQSRGKTFTAETDHPEVFAAPDAAPTPVELVLSGLAGCITAGVATVAENRGIKLRSVKATLEGEMNLHGILGVDSDVRNGFSAVRVNYDNRCGRQRRRHRGSGRPIAKAVGCLRHHHQPDERFRHGQQIVRVLAYLKEERVPCATQQSSFSGPDRRVWR